MACTRIPPSTAHSTQYGLHQSSLAETPLLRYAISPHHRHVMSALRACTCPDRDHAGPSILVGPPPPPPAVIWPRPHSAPACGRTRLWFAQSPADTHSAADGSSPPYPPCSR